MFGWVKDQVQSAYRQVRNQRGGVLNDLLHGGMGQYGKHGQIHEQFNENEWQDMSFTGFQTTGFDLFGNQPIIYGSELPDGSIDPTSSEWDLDFTGEESGAWWQDAITNGIALAPHLLSDGTAQQNYQQYQQPASGQFNIPGVGGVTFGGGSHGAGGQQMNIPLIPLAIGGVLLALILKD